MAPGGHGNQHGGAPGAPYHIPATVLLDPDTVIDSASWPGIEKMFWDACTGGTHCVDPRLVPIAKAGKAPCQFDHVSPGVGTGVRFHTVINVYVGAPCPPDGTGDSLPPESPDSAPPPPPDSEPPSSP